MLCSVLKRDTEPPCMTCAKSPHDSAPKKCKICTIRSLTTLNIVAYATCDCAEHDSMGILALQSAYLCSVMELSKGHCHFASTTRDVADTGWGCLF